MAEVTPTTSRRAMLGVLAAAPVALTLPAIAAAGNDLEARLRQFDEWAVDINARGHLASANELDRWEEASQLLYEEIERLPCTRENARIKALAVISINERTPSEYGTDDCTDTRLVRQVLAALSGSA